MRRRHPLGVYLVAVGTLDGGTEQAMVSGEDLRVAVTQLLQKARGALDIGKEEGDRPGRQTGHTCGLRALHLGRLHRGGSAVLAMVPRERGAPNGDRSYPGS